MPAGVVVVEKVLLYNLKWYFKKARQYLTGFFIRTSPRPSQKERECDSVKENARYD